MITTEQRIARKQYAGSSDAAAILGIDPYRNASDVYLEKTGQADGFGGNANTERGNFLEPAIINWFRHKCGLPCSNDVMRVHADGLLAANFDGINLDDKFTVEAKSATNPDEWGAEETDEIPERHIVQVHHGMYVAGPEFRVAYVPVLLPGYRSLDFKLYRVDRNDALADAIAGQCSDFMQTHVRLGIPPTDFRPSLEVLKRVRREPNKTVALADNIVSAWIVARAARLQAAEHEEEKQRELLTALSDAEAGTFSGGRVTYFSATRKSYTVNESTYRTLRLPKAAKEKL